MNSIEKVKYEIEKIIALSEVPEDPVHSKNTKEWVLKLKPDADIALQIAALGHDIERSIKDRKVNREDYIDYDEFKKVHSSNSAKILKEILSKYNIDKKTIEKIIYLVKHHEFGGDSEADILKDADSISFFDVNLPFYFQRSSRENIIFRVKWGYQRLSENSRAIVKTFRYEIAELDLLCQNIILNQVNDKIKKILKI